MTTSAHYDKFRRLLAELFMFDQADLDFGIYRIMNAKRGEIERFLERDLLPQVRETLGALQTGDRASLETELHKAVEAAKSLGVDPESSPKVQQLRAQLGEAGDLDALAAEVFSDLYNFFRRYYRDGDFISQRRYKEGVYAIPYEGEEVKLHWANHDQYYVKSTEYFRDYTFKLRDGRRVHFRLAEADTERDNNRAPNGNERRFILCADQPLVEQDGELVIRFQWGKDPDGRTQDQLRAEARNRIFATPGFACWTDELMAKAPTAANPDRTLLERHLAEYTARNTFDYFIHKNLASFLRRELDFYIKNEIVHLDDIESESAPRVEQYLAKVRAIRRIAHKIIDFLAQIEDFQKKLWLKKKFVVETNYCITLDRVPEGLYPEVAANDAQREEWVRLFNIDAITDDLATPGYSEPLTTGFLQANRFLLLDTRFFDSSFTQRLLASIAHLDDTLDGLLIHSENYQALRFVDPRLRSQITCACIDPPYNTGEEGFLYKDQYQHSSWLALLRDRLQPLHGLLKPTGCVCVHIDDIEYKHLWFALGDALGPQNYVGSLVWKRRSSSAMSGKPLSLDHEYILMFGADASQTRLFGLTKSIDTYPFVDEATGRRYASTDLTIGATREQRPNQFFPIKNPRTGREYWPSPHRVWRFFPETMEQVIRDDLVIWPDEAGGNMERPRYKTFYDPESARPRPVSSWIESAGVNDRELAADEVDYELNILQSGMNQEGGRVVARLFGSKAFAYPKPVSLVRALVRAATRGNDIVLDHFAGSGTTGHAVIEMNREDGANRRYVLVEMGEYFDHVLKPRIQRVIYSRSWTDGKPTTRDGMGHAFKYLRLESYEDALNNLVVRRRDDQRDLLDSEPALREDYTLRYMLDEETRGSPSLLNVRSFEDPFSYRMRIATGTVGETRDVAVDLVETFNWLLGLRVKHLDTIRGVRVVEGTNPDGERVLVLWRNTKEIDNDKLDEWFTRQGYNTRDQEYAIIYVNGDNNLENLRRADQTWKVRITEDEFHRLMFDVQDV